MAEFLTLFNQYARSELMVLAPVLFIINKLLYESKVNNTRIPLISCVISITLCALYTLSISPLISVHSVLLAIFTSVTQGVLFAGASMFAGVLIDPSSVLAIVEASKNPEKK